MQSNLAHLLILIKTKKNNKIEELKKTIIPFKYCKTADKEILNNPKFVRRIAYCLRKGLSSCDKNIKGFPYRAVDHDLIHYFNEDKEYTITKLNY